MTKENQRSIPFVFKLIIGLLAFTGMFIASMIFGAADTTIKDVWHALTSDAMSDNISIIREIRLPREIAGDFCWCSTSGFWCNHARYDKKSTC